MRSHRTGRGAAGLALCAATIAALVPGAVRGASQLPSISADGKHVAFQSVATNFATGTDMWTPNVYVRDLG
jgi:hypothetical protein